MQRKQKAKQRVDIQVMIVVAIFTFISTTVTAGIYWTYTFNTMMSSLEERVYALYNAVEQTLDEESFRVINTIDDMNTDLYRDTMRTLLSLKNASGVEYLYTAKINDEAKLIYIIDGLEDHLDFRYPGDLIEQEIKPAIFEALSNIPVVPKNILHTEWGEIFVAYMPFHASDGTVIGVVGIEFDATEVSSSYNKLVRVTPIIIIGMVILAVILSKYLFKRISNPLYMDKNIIDEPTGLKNRNAYEVDINNLIAQDVTDDVGIIVADINGLKEVNDRLGHIDGDEYIKIVANSIKEHKTKDMIAYRTGGDEFVIILRNAKEEVLTEFIEKCSKQVKEQKHLKNMRCSLACGFAIFDGTCDTVLSDTFRRADDSMYTEKKRQKEEKVR